MLSNLLESIRMSYFFHAFLSLGIIAFSQHSIAKDVDYLKCEAMQRAIDRISQSPIMLQGMQLAGLKEESRILNTGRNPSRVEILRARLDYVQDLRNDIGDPVLVKEMKKIQRIESDLRAAGCPS